MTFYDGTFDSGTILRFSPFDGTVSNIFNFDGTNAGVPFLNDMTYDSTSGLLYGCTSGGGIGGRAGPLGGGDGVLFSFDPNSHQFTQLYLFSDTGTTNMAYPQGGPLKVGTRLYEIGRAHV